jgi:aminopeptidase N
VSNKPSVTYRKDYQAPAYRIESVDLHFTLGEEATVVTSTLEVVRQTHAAVDAPLCLHGEDLVLNWLKLDGQSLETKDYQLDEKTLTIHQVPAQFQLSCQVTIKPQENTQLSGLYKSSGNFCTQCEAEGFRRITYYLDRPDNMASFSTTIVADKHAYPVLLSNGNLIDSGELDNQQHFAKWQDPFKKPSYLFALVAGKLNVIEDSFTTMSQREIALRLFVQPGNEDKTAHALSALKQAMRWDEQQFGREYDLDIFMIVAVDDFNMGAMENKGLNIFNSQCVLANPQTATDEEYTYVTRVVAHEYFHNWTGNRVTCRDWFQLSLKEGLTVYRDQEFTCDVTSRDTRRIDDVIRLRNAQFAEDAGPLAHPVRPDSYIEINNFYTATVYEKGAEVIRMMQQLLGRDNFRKGMDLYFERHDGQAVTCDDFVKAMEDANGVDLDQFRLWYSQAGTPELDIEEQYHAETQTYRLQVKQHCPDTPGQANKQAMHIPLAIALLDKQGQEIQGSAQILQVREFAQSFQFTEIKHKPTLSLLRGFSAPIKAHMAYTEEALAFLLRHDNDAFARWEAGQRLASRIILDNYQLGLQQAEYRAPSLLIESLRALLSETDAEISNALLAKILVLPSETYLQGQLSAEVDPVALHQARCFVRRAIAEQLQPQLQALYTANHTQQAYVYDNQAMTLRSLKNIALAYLTATNTADSIELAYQQFTQANNMTDSMAALHSLNHQATPQREQALQSFYQQWQHDSLVMDKWFSLQALSELPDTLMQVKQLLQHPAFNFKNPNKVRALIASFASGNQAHFHTIDGAGYAFLAEQIIALNHYNPQIAARLVTPLSKWRKFDNARQQLMREQLERIMREPKLSDDVYECVEKSL